MDTVSHEVLLFITLTPMDAIASTTLMDAIASTTPMDAIASTHETFLSDRFEPTPPSTARSADGR